MSANSEEDVFQDPAGGASEGDGAGIVVWKDGGVGSGSVTCSSGGCASEPAAVAVLRLCLTSA
jgi:hypothetical protein